MENQKKQIKTMQDLTNDLVGTYEALRNGTINVDEAKAVAKVASSIIVSCKLQLSYNYYIKSNKRIDFMEY